ncbi:MAG TPA: hypothetical protein PK299_04970 [Anaerolineales bacterium]|nr:hypothetical protein [Anaerolineales bacterium]
MITEDKEPIFELVVAILVAIATVTGAIIAWRASVVADAAGDADYAGLRAQVNTVEVRSLSFVNAYEHYGAFVEYAGANELGNTIGNELQTNDTLDEEAQDDLADKQAEAYDLARANQSLFPSRFMTRDGGYAVQREIAESWADAAREKDLAPEPQFAEADHLRGVTNRILLALAVLSISVVFYALIESVGDKLRVPFFMIGTGFLLLGSIAAVVFEWLK